ncbi:phage holin family protein [Novosphingobium sp. B 225]|uniref:phage holin family protein n=1 Tax=Novosphingobium sp. B 225 TaxID=1961849 RepID=UPI000B4B9EA5|nr:phage holin family protein [Novosphingobium sp. B 225]
MTEPEPPLIKDSPADAAERSLVEDLRQLASDGRTLLEAELAYQKSRAAVAGQGAKAIAGWGTLALVLVMFALMALTFGLVLGLASMFGPWWATLISVLLLLLAAGLSGLIAARRWSAMSRQLSDTVEGP